MKDRMAIDTNFWGRKNVLITGYRGFLGSNLTKTLIPMAARVSGLDIESKRKNYILDNSDYKKIDAIKGSVDNYELIKDIIYRHKIKIIFHLAAEAIVGRALENPLKAFSTNIKGTWNILEACRKLGTVDAVIIASSDKAYGSPKKLPLKEDMPLAGDHPYDVSKSCADLIASTYHHSYQVPMAITRCGNIYGPGDMNLSRIVPDTIRCAISHKTLSIRSDGKFTRDYIYIDDIINGYMLLAQELRRRKLSGEAFNFSNEHPITVIKLVKEIYRISGQKPDYKILDQTKCEIKHQYLSSAKARMTLGWKPEHDLEEGLAKTIQWYRGIWKI